MPGSNCQNIKQRLNDTLRLRFWYLKITCQAKLRPKNILRTSPKDVLWTSPYGPLCNAKRRPLLTS